MLFVELEILFENDGKLIARLCDMVWIGYRFGGEYIQALISL